MDGQVAGEIENNANSAQFGLSRDLAESLAIEKKNHNTVA